MKKITFFIDRYKPSSLATSTRFEPILDELLKSDIFEIVIRTDIQSQGEPNVKPNFFRSPTNDLSFGRRVLQEVLLGIEWFLKVIFLKNDLIVFSSPPFFSTLIASFGCWLFGKAYVVDIRDKYPDVFAEVNLIKKNGLLHVILIYFERFLYNKAEKVITVTPLLKTTIENMTLSEKSILIQNGFNSDVFVVNNLKFDKFTVVFHGNLGRFQLPELLIEVAKQMDGEDKNVDFIVIGDGPKETFFESLKLSNLRFLGRLENQETATIISKCHLGISFRTNDEISKKSLPVKIFEYMGVGIPILVVPRNSEGGILVETLGVGLAFEENQLGDVIQTIREFSHNSDLYRSLKESILTRRLHYTRQSSALQFKLAIETVLT